MKIIDISCWYNDSAVAFVEDGIIKAAVLEERFSRNRHDPKFPINSLLWIQEKYNLEINEIEYIAYYEDLFLKLSRIRYANALSWSVSLKNFKKDIDSQEKREIIIKKKLTIIVN